MPGDPPNEPAEDWEFKVLRSRTGAFREPGRMRAILGEEARAGWSLVEKFDNHRIRLRRPTSARDGDHTLDFDPYRAFESTSRSQSTIALWIALGIFVGLTAIMLLMSLIALLLER